MRPDPGTFRARQSARRELIMLLGIAGFTACMALFYFMLPRPDPEPNHLKGGTSLHAHPRAFPEFSLTDHRGQEFTSEALKHSWNFVFFGYTYCPDICPATLATLDRVLGTLASRDDLHARGIFISVDPNRDTQPRLRSYVQYFNQEIIGLTGSDTDLENLCRELGVVYSTPAGQESEGYLVDHSTPIFLVSPDGNLLALFGTPHDSQHIVDDFRTLNAYYSAQQGS